MSTWAQGSEQRVMQECPASSKQEPHTVQRDVLTELWQKMASDPRLKGAVPALDKAQVYDFEKLIAVFAELVGWLRQLEKCMAEPVKTLLQHGDPSKKNKKLTELVDSYRGAGLVQAIRDVLESDGEDAQPGELLPAPDVSMHILTSLYRPVVAIAKGLNAAVNPGNGSNLELIKQELVPDTWEETFNLAKKLGPKRWGEDNNERLVRALREHIRPLLASKICENLQKMASVHVEHLLESTRAPDLDPGDHGSSPE